MPIATPTTLLPQAFATSGAKNVIPTASASPLASLTDGFPTITMQPLSSGGVPPAGQDFNGILNWITTLLAWTNSGGLYPFNAAQSTATSGYHKGAFLILDDAETIVMSTADGNTNNPNSVMTNWIEVLGPTISWDRMLGGHVSASGIPMHSSTATNFTLSIIDGVLTQTVVS